MTVVFAVGVLVAYPVASFAVPRVRRRRAGLASNGVRRPSLAEGHTRAAHHSW